MTAILGGIFGFLLAYAVILGGLPKVLRDALMTFSGVASNFAGVPLALAFIFTLGQLGVLTLWLRGLGINLYASDFTIYSKIGLEIVYLYFQFPLMVLIIAPAIDGLRPEWREAAENMGASSREYWRRVALPILAPTLIGTIILLFGNAFGAQATAYQLTSGQIPLVPLLIGNQISGDVLHNPGLGYAMAMGMVVIMAVSDRRLHRCCSAEPSGGADEATSRRHRLVARLPDRRALLHPAALRDARLLAQGQAVLLGLHERPVGPASSSRASGTRWSWASSRSSPAWR